MMPNCMAYSSRRWEVAKRTPGRHAECLFPTAEGPFPYAKGAFTAFSMDTARLITAKLEEDERFVATNRSRIPLIRPDYNKLYPVNHRYHPGTQILLEDVYYSYLVFRELSTGNVTLVNMPMSEYVKERLHRNMFPFPAKAHIYHKLRHPVRFEFLLNRTSYLRIDYSKVPRCAPMHKRYRPTASMTHCCEQWTYCSYWNWHSSVVPTYSGRRQIPAGTDVSIDVAVREQAGLEKLNAQFDESERAAHFLEVEQELASTSAQLAKCKRKPRTCSARVAAKLRISLTDLEVEWDLIRRRISHGNSRIGEPNGPATSSRR